MARIKTSNDSKPENGNIRHKITKQETTNYLNSTLTIGTSKSMANRKSINKGVRIRKSSSDDFVDSWELVPKDSCEVYKARRKRQIESRRTHDDPKRRTTENSSTERDQNPKVARKVDKNENSPRRRRRRVSRESGSHRSSQSDTGSETSVSRSTVSSSDTSSSTGIDS